MLEVKKTFTQEFESFSSRCELSVRGLPKPNDRLGSGQIF
jgi:hypothetical protein